MKNPLIEIFRDIDLIERIRNKLPFLFHIAEIESSRAGKIGMEVGSLREKILIALLIYKFGEENVNTDLPITMSEVDVEVFNRPVSIKTITGGYSGVKVSWTVDPEKAGEFADRYEPKYDIILAQIKWDLSDKAIENGINTGGLFLIPVELQEENIKKVGGENYIKLPKPGTNPRGVEIDSKSLKMMLEDERTHKIEIIWKHADYDYNPYKRWVDYWEEDEISDV
jgi:hypothetical protein